MNELMTRLSILILTIGIPGAGKSTWVKEYVSKHHAVQVISSDEIRKELTGTRECDPSQSLNIHEEARRRVKDILDFPEKYGYVGPTGPEIIIDSTNVELSEWLKYRELGPTLMYAKIFNVPPEIAMAHQLVGRKDRVVPYEILESKWKQLQENLHHIPSIFNFVIE